MPLCLLASCTSRLSSAMYRSNSNTDDYGCRFPFAIPSKPIKIICENCKMAECSIKRLVFRISDVRVLDWFLPYQFYSEHVSGILRTQSCSYYNRYYFVRTVVVYWIVSDLEAHNIFYCSNQFLQPFREFFLKQIQITSVLFFQICCIYGEKRW